MKRRSFVVASVLIVVLLLIQWARWTEPLDPEYQGKPLSAWLDDRQTIRGSVILSDEAVQAVRAIGPTAVPTLLAWLGTADSSLFRLSRRLHSSAYLPIKFAEHEKERTRAMYGFRALGPVARSAFPAIVAIILNTDDGRQGGDAINALTNSDADTMRLLAHGLQSSDSQIQSQAIQALRYLRIAPDEVCLPALEALSHDPHPGIRQQAANAITFINSQLSSIVPALSDQNPTFRAIAAQIIGGYRTHARAYLPNLEAAADDEDSQVRAAVAEAIRQVKGD